MKELIIQQLEEASNPTLFKKYQSDNQPEPFFGTPMSLITKVSSIYKNDNELAKDLYNTEILEAQLAAIQMVNPKTIEVETLEKWSNSKYSTIVLDKLVNYVISKGKQSDYFIELFSQSTDLNILRMSWMLKIRKVISQKYQNHEISELLSEIEFTLPFAQEPLKWAINQTLNEIGVYYDEFTQESIQLGEQIGAYKDQKVAKGCTPSYAPVWIEVARYNRDQRKKR